MGAPGIQIDFQQQNQIGIGVGQEFDNALKLQAAIDVPVHHPEGRWAEKTATGSEQSCPSRFPASGSRVFSLRSCKGLG